MRQAQLFARLVLLGAAGCLPRLPYCRVCAKVMDELVEEIDGDSEGLDNGRDVMQVGWVNGSMFMGGVKVSERFTWH